jgi:carbonic anhydrase
MHSTLVALLKHNAKHASEYDTRFEGLQHGQHPEAVTVCCSDSRVLQDQMWGNDDPGHLFTCGNIGNRVIDGADGEEFVSGDVLYPIEHTGTDLAVVVGHTGCGAVTATYDALTDGVSEPPGIERCLDLLKPRLEDGVKALPDDIDRSDAINRLVECNVDRQVQFLRESDDVPEGVSAVGAVYDFQDVYGGKRGEVHVINVDGERSTETLREEHPEIAERIDRLWEY